MNNLFLDIIKHLSKYDINMKENYLIYSHIQNKTPLQKRAKLIKDKKFTYHFFIPSNFETKKVVIYLHGGGWTTGSVKFYSHILSILANQLKRNIIAFDYPLAPEHPFPEGLNFCYEAIENLIKNSSKYRIDQSQIIIMGDSAGANLATAICLKAKKEKNFKIKKEILLYPIVQTNFKNNKKYKSIEENGYDYFLNKKLISDYLDLYIPNKKYYKNKYVAPLYAKNLFNMPETLIITANLDPLRDEGYAYAQKLKHYFNKVTYYNIKNVIHGFFNNFLYFKENYRVIKIIKRFVGDKIE